MPRGSPRKKFNLRLDPELMERMRAETGNLAQAVEDASREWIERRRRARVGGREAQPDVAESELRLGTTT